MKVIDCYRHSIKTGPGDNDLSEEGKVLAEKVGSTLRGRGYTALFLSRLNRTRQTLEIFKRCAGDFSEVEPQIFRPNAAAETERGMTLWSGVCNTAEHRGEDMLEAALTKAPEISNEIAKDGASAFKQWLTGLPDSSQVLVVGHSPFLELIVFGLLNIKIPALQPCDGFRLIEVNGELKYQPL